MSIVQSSTIKVAIFSTTLALLFAMGFLSVNAQEGDTAETIAAADAQAAELAAQDENITHQDLGVGDPNILPGNPLYAFKNARRGIQSFFTFDPAAKAELKLKFANEKISEVKKLEEGGATDERVKSAIENYEKETVRVKVRIENLKDSGKTKEEIELIIKHTADSQIKHHKALGKVMKNREDIAPEIEEAKALAMKHFSESMATVVEPEVLQQKFEEVLKEQKGSAFRHFKHVEVLEEVKDFVPEQAKGAIQNAIKQSSKFFEEEFKTIEQDQRKIFNKYIEKIGGNEVRHLEAFDSLGAFADIEKEMFAEMEKGREKTRKRVEERMKGIKDETRKQVFVAHLQDGKFEDARIVKELETNLDPGTITSILDMKHKMEEGIRAKFEQAESTGDLNSFFQEMEKFNDVQMLGVLNDMETIIPQDKKDFFQEMKKKAMTEMQKGMEQARQFGRFEDELHTISGFDPEHMAVLDKFEGEFGPQFNFFEDVRKEQSERIQQRFEHFREFAEEAKLFPPPAFFDEGQERRDAFIGPPTTGFDHTDFLKKAEEFRLRIQSDPAAQAQIQQFAPKIDQQFTQFDTQRARADVSRENLAETVKKAEEFVQKLSQKLVETGDDNPGKNAARELYNNASSHLADITLLISQGKTGEAFGQANSATHLASNGLRKLEKEAFQAERKDYFGERDKFREKFRDLPAHERPDPSQFLKFESQVFPSFELPPGTAFPRPTANGNAERTKPVSDRERGDEQKPVFCAQVLTPARHKIAGKCVTFPNSCIPIGWERVGACPENEETESLLDDRRFIRDEVRVIPIGRHPLEEELLRKAEEQQKTTPTPAPTPAPTHDQGAIDATKRLEGTFRQFIPVAPTSEQQVSPLPITAPKPTETILPLPITPTPITTPTTEQKILEQQRILEQQTVQQPTQVAPTTVSPTTVSPTTVSPTTVSPTTVSPTPTFDSGAQTSSPTGGETTSGGTTGGGGGSFGF